VRVSDCGRAHTDRLGRLLALQTERVALQCDLKAARAATESAVAQQQQLEADLTESVQVRCTERGGGGGNSIWRLARRTTGTRC
jgi:hypothetical protein